METPPALVSVGAKYFSRLHFCRPYLIINLNHKITHIENSARKKLDWTLRKLGHYKVSLFAAHFEGRK